QPVGLLDDDHVAQPLLPPRPGPQPEVLDEPDDQRAHEERLVVPDTLGTTIKLSFLLGPLAWRQRATASGAGAATYIRPAVATRLETRCPLGFWFGGPTPCRYSHPRAGRPATECERSRALLALAGTPADSAPTAAKAWPCSFA